MILARAIQRPNTSGKTTQKSCQLERRDSFITTLNYVRDKRDKALGRKKANLVHVKTIGVRVTHDRRPSIVDSQLTSGSRV